MSKIIQPLKIGNFTVEHRLSLAPLTRLRADDEHVPIVPLVKKYYIQRSTTPGTLLVTEGIQISPRFSGYANAPGIWSALQIAAWKEITAAVHAKDCRIICQLWVPGRAASQASLDAFNQGYRVLSSSSIPISPASPTPVQMTEEDIHDVISHYATAARTAVFDAGFDGVELHAGNGYLPDQFLQDTCNRRTDDWGGSVANRARFTIEVLSAIAAAVGPERTAVRLSPWSDFQGMLMDDPRPTFEYLVRALRPMGLMFLDLIEARIRGNDDADCGAGEDNTFLITAWGNASPVLLSGGFDAEKARWVVDEKYKDYDVGVMFGRYFVSNPDLVFRVREGVALAKYERKYFYTPKTPVGYVDWPFSREYEMSCRRRDDTDGAPNPLEA